MVEIKQGLYSRESDSERLTRIKNNSDTLTSSDVQWLTAHASTNLAKSATSRTFDVTFDPFKRLRDVSVRRSERVWAIQHKSWSAMEWACAMAGEAGEVCNAVKKMRRDNVDNVHDIAGEIADTIIYLDLLANHLGIDLWPAIVEKFNESSMKVGSPIMLTL